MVILFPASPPRFAWRGRGGGSPPELFAPAKGWSAFGWDEPRAQAFGWYYFVILPFKFSKIPKI